MSAVKLPRFSVFFLLVVVSAAFVSTLGFGFVNFDDYTHLHENTALTHFHLADIWTKPYFGLYAPMTYTLWALEWGLTKVSAGGDPSAFIFHAGSLLFHLLNALLVYWLFLQMRLRNFYAVTGALIFALHPVQVESVAWISSFRDLLAAFWGLLYLNFSLRTLSSGTPRPAIAKLSLGAILLFLFVLAVLSKPSAVVFALLLPTIMFFLGERPGKIQNIFVGASLFVGALFVILAQWIQPPQMVDLIPSLWEKIPLAAQSLAFYAAKILWPAKLTPDYGLNATALLKAVHESLLPTALSLLVILLVGRCLWQAWRRGPVAIGFLLAVIGVLPYLGFFVFNFQNVSMVADRYLYLAMIGVGFALASLLSAVKTPARLSPALAGGLIGILGLLSFVQCQVWKSDEALYNRMVEFNEHSFYGYGGLGTRAMLQGQMETALPLLQKAVDLRGTFQPARHNLARVLEAQGRTKEALENYVRLINIDPGFVEAYRDLAGLLIRQNRLAEAENVLEHGLEVAPSSADLYATKGDLTQACGDSAAAEVSYRKALELNPRHYLAHKALGFLAAARGDTREAAEHWNFCRQLDPARAEREKVPR